MLQSLPIWVRFHDFGVHLALSHVASNLGKPFFMDLPTTRKSNVNYALACIEIDARDEFPRSVLANVGEDLFEEVGIDYG